MEPFKLDDAPDRELCGVGGVLRLCLFSGGLVSWATAKRVVQEFGTDGVVLLFADTMMEEAKPESADPCLNHRDGIPSQHCPCAACNVRTTACGGSAPHGSASSAGTELEREMSSLFEEWWAKDRTPWMHANKDGARFLFTIAFLAGRESQRKQPATALSMTPNPL